LHPFSFRGTPWIFPLSSAPGSAATHTASTAIPTTPKNKLNADLLAFIQS
jgi:hypothetical protein